jgi:head-tail adaptor
VEIANEKDYVIQVQAEKKAALLLENERNRIRGELRNLVNQQSGYILEKLESFKKQLASVQADFSDKLSDSREEMSTVNVKIAERKDADVEIAKESDTIVAKITEERDTTSVKIEKKKDTVVAEEHKKTLDEHLELSQEATDHTEKSFKLSNLLQIEEQAELGKPQWEVEIMPPFDITKIMEVVSYLDQLPEVANTEMIVPQIDMPSILVFLRKPMDFVDVLQTIPAVAYVEEVASDTAASNGKPRKVRIGLSGDIMSPKKK